jgi:hypothetical protein
MRTVTACEAAPARTASSAGRQPDRINGTGTFGIPGDSQGQTRRYGWSGT